MTDYTLSYYIKKKEPVIVYPNKLCSLLKLRGEISIEFSQWQRKVITFKSEKEPDFDLLMHISMAIEKLNGEDVPAAEHYQIEEGSCTTSLICLTQDSYYCK